MKYLKQHISPKLTGSLVILLMISLVSWAWAYERRSSDANSVRFDVKPLQLDSGQQAKFQIRMNTHSADLGYDMLTVSILKDDQGREYQPLNWNGSPPGGHHRSGILEFPPIPKDSKVITLVLKTDPERIFEWKLGQ